MNPPGRPMPADVVELDHMLHDGDALRLTKRLASPPAGATVDLDLNWEQARLFDGAGLMIGLGYTARLWQVAAALPPQQGEGIRQSAAMMFLYSYDLIAVDGVRCGDPSAPVHRRDQLFTEYRPIFDYLRSLPIAVRMQLGTISLGIEAATAKVRKNDPVLCRGGLDEIRAGLAAQGAKPLSRRPNAPGTVGKTYAVPSPPEFAPTYVEDAVAAPKQVAARQALPAMLTQLLDATPVPQAPAK